MATGTGKWLNATKRGTSPRCGVTKNDISGMAPSLPGPTKSLPHRSIENNHPSMAWSLSRRGSPLIGAVFLQLCKACVSIRVDNSFEFGRLPCAAFNSFSWRLLYRPPLGQRAKRRGRFCSQNPVLCDPKAGMPSIPMPSMPDVTAGDLVGGCGRGRIRDPHTHGCRGPADIR